MQQTKAVVTVREARLSDIPKLVKLSRAAYAELTDKNAVWEEEQLRSHLRVFPEGQLVAEVAGKVVGAAASFIANLGPNPLRYHTWDGITDSGFFTSHDPNADTLYGADVYVHPEARSMGVGAALYEARRQLCSRLNKRRILAGGRLWNYSEQAEKMTPAEYAQMVSLGKLSDLVLSFQLRQGFMLRGVIPHYMRDPNSRSFASLIEWLNPDYKPLPTGNRKVRVACVQYQMSKVDSFAGFARRVKYFIDVAADYRADFVLLPELFTMQLLSQTSELTPQEGMKRLSGYTSRFKKLMSGLAQQFGLTIIAGSHPSYKKEQLLNICYVCLPNGEIVEQPKIHITRNERHWWGIRGGHTLTTIDTPKAKIGVLICYDIEFPEAPRYLADQGAEIIFVPFCTDNRQAYLRVRYCAHARAIENEVYVALAGNVGNLPDVSNMDIQYAQSAVLTPSDFAFARDGILAEAQPNEETLLICDLDLDSLHRARSNATVTPRLDRAEFQKQTAFSSHRYKEDESGRPLPSGGIKITM
jgi:predicted amidohydrolase/ribosomal protein S18 acetylase RimI-like enzyme